MSSNVTRAELRALARLYADERPETTNGFLTAAELNTVLDLELRSLYDRLISARGHDYYEAESTFTTTSGSATYAFSSMTPTAANFYEVRRLQIEWNSVEIEPIGDFKKSEEIAYRNWNTWGKWTPKGFRVVGAGIKLVPTPNTTGTTLRLLYVPAFATLASDGATFDGVNGWHDAVALGAAIKMLKLKKEDARALEEERQIVLQRIDEMAADRAADEPHRVIDVCPEGDYYWRRRLPLWGLPRP